MKPDESLKMDDFVRISPLVRGYELRTDRAYLIVADGKDFNPGLIQSLMQDIRQMHPDVNIAIVMSLKAKSIEVQEKLGSLSDAVLKYQERWRADDESKIELASNDEDRRAEAWKKIVDLAEQIKKL